MFGSPEIHVTFPPNGKGPVIEGKDFPDGSCLKETKTLQEALGKVKEQKLKPEAAKLPKIEEKVKVGR